jgi:endoglucanase
MFSGARAAVLGLFCINLAVLGVTFCAPSVQPPAVSAALASPLEGGRKLMLGVNLASANFGLKYSDWPGTYGVEYVYPSEGELDYYNGKRLPLIRLPFSWERVQLDLFGPLNQVEVARIRGFVTSANARGMQVILDAHDFGRYRPFDEATVIGSAAVPIAGFQDFWTKMAAEFAGVAGIFGYDIENEPHDMGGSAVWPRAAQAAVDGIRTVDRSTAIIVEGDGWSNAAHWRSMNSQLAIDDPSDHIIFSAHLYFDRDGSGRYVGTYDQEQAYPDIGADRLRPFAEWLKQHRYSGYIGEYGVPGDDPRWLTVLDRFLEAVRKEDLPATYWAGGPWWGDYPLSVEPANGEDRPQMGILAKYPVTMTGVEPLPQISR